MPDHTPLGCLHVLIFSSHEAEAAEVLLSLRHATSVEHLLVQTQRQLIDALDCDKWDLLLADDSLSDFGVRDVLAYLQSAGRDLPVIAMAHSADEAQIVEVMQAGASDFITYGNHVRLMPAVRRAVLAFRRRTEAKLAVGKSRVQSHHLNGQPLERLLDNSRISVMAWDAESDRITYHRNFESIFGEPYQPHDSHPAHFFARLHHEDRAYLEQTQYADIISQDALFYECRVIWPDESVHWVRALGKVIRDDQQSVSQVVTVVQNVTDQKQSAKPLTFQEKERTVTRLHRRFMMMAAHEFRTPLTVISTANELLCEYYDQMSVEKHKEYLLEIRSRVRVLRDMLTEVESAARDELISLEFTPQAANVEVLCQRIIAEVRDTYALEGYNPASHPIHFHYRLVHPVQVIDSRLTGHILRQLLDNAIKFSADGLEIDLTVWQSADALYFSVRDEGIGIPQEDLPYIYELFMRGSNIGAISGRGIGLKLVMDCVQAHEGKISLRSRVNHGTTFTVMLPIKTDV